MLVRRIFICLIITIAGWVIISPWLLDIAPPAPQKTTRIEVGIAQLKPEDQWLQKVHFQVIPLDGVKSAHKYAILLLTPPAEGVHSAAGSIASLDLTASTAFWTAAAHTPGSHSFPEGIQPTQIGRNDFGPNGDQVVVKFFDGYQYNSSQRLLIGSSPD
jgi:hypothetical protein